MIVAVVTLASVAVIVSAAVVIPILTLDVHHQQLSAFDEFVGLLKP
jgi:hypothetical protein